MAEILAETRTADRRHRRHPRRHGGQVARLPLHRHEQAWPTSSRARGPAHAGVHREVLRRGVPLLRRHDHASQRPRGGVWSISQFRRPCSRPGGHRTALRQDRQDLPADHLRQGPDRRLLRPRVRRPRPSAVRGGRRASPDGLRRALRPGPSFSTPTPRSRRSFGSSSAASRTVEASRRRAALRRPPAGRPLRPSQPYALLDLKCPEGEPVAAAPDSRTATDAGPIIDWSLDEVSAEYFGEIKERRHGNWASRRSTSASRSSSSSANRTKDRQVRQPVSRSSAIPTTPRPVHPGQPRQGGRPARRARPAPRGPAGRN